MYKEGGEEIYFGNGLVAFICRLIFFCFNIFLHHCFIELSSFALSKPIILIPIFRKHFSPFWHADPRAIFQASFLGEMKWKKEINWLVSSSVVCSNVSVWGSKIDYWKKYWLQVFIHNFNDSFEPLKCSFSKLMQVILDHNWEISKAGFCKLRRDKYGSLFSRSR